MALSLTMSAASPDASWKEGYLARIRFSYSGGVSASYLGLLKTVSNASLLALIPKGPLRSLLDFTKAIPAATSAGIAASAARTQAQMRALLLSDDPTEATLVSPFTPRAIITSQSRSTTLPVGCTITHSIDVSVDASGKPTLLVRVREAGSAATISRVGASAQEFYVTLMFCAGNMR